MKSKTARSPLGDVDDIDPYVKRRSHLRREQISIRRSLERAFITTTLSPACTPADESNRSCLSQAAGKRTSRTARCGFGRADITATTIIARVMKKGDGTYNLFSCPTGLPRFQVGAGFHTVVIQGPTTTEPSHAYAPACRVGTKAFQPVTPDYVLHTICTRQRVGRRSR